MLIQYYKFSRWYLIRVIRAIRDSERNPRHPRFSTPKTHTPALTQRKPMLKHVYLGVLRERYATLTF